MASVSTSLIGPSTTLPPQLEQSLTERCDICNETLGLPGLNGQIERAVVLPCSHVFGSACITRWLESDSAYKNCPNCRRRMVYRGCGHFVKPCDVARAPQFVCEKDMPDKCLVCRSDGVLAEQLRLRRERQLAEQRELEGIKIYLPRIFGGLCRITVNSVDSGVKESRDAWRRDMEELCAQLRQGDRDQW